MSTESEGIGETGFDESAEDRGAEGEAAEDPRNGVAVHFTNGDVAHYAFVVREHDGSWLYAERIGGGEEFGEEDVESINAETVCRIAADRVHLFDDGVVHMGADLVADPAELLEDSWVDADAVIL